MEPLEVPPADDDMKEKLETFIEVPGGAHFGVDTADNLSASSVNNLIDDISDKKGPLEAEVTNFKVPEIKEKVQELITNASEKQTELRTHMATIRNLYNISKAAPPKVPIKKTEPKPAGDTVLDAEAVVKLHDEAAAEPVPDAEAVVKLQALKDLLQEAQDAKLRVDDKKIPATDDDKTDRIAELQNTDLEDLKTKLDAAAADTTTGDEADREKLETLKNNWDAIIATKNDLLNDYEKLPVVTYNNLAGLFAKADEFLGYMEDFKHLPGDPEMKAKLQEFHVNAGDDKYDTVKSAADLSQATVNNLMNHISDKKVFLEDELKHLKDEEIKGKVQNLITNAGEKHNELTTRMNEIRYHYDQSQASDATAEETKKAAEEKVIKLFETMEEMAKGSKSDGDGDADLKEAKAGLSYLNSIWTTGILDPAGITEEMESGLQKVKAAPTKLEKLDAVLQTATNAILKLPTNDDKINKGLSKVESSVNEAIQATKAEVKVEGGDKPKDGGPPDNDVVIKLIDPSVAA
eukprot:GHVU01225372.1.p1 GENE.GHVU01225372.1~~GHVU01225372.1.p1  ORF type:complete len:520 (-),score=124.87 GHVU01225372.1:1113-2672(-)